MSNIYTIIVEGRSTRSLELKKTQKGTDALTVNVATTINTGKKDENGKLTSDSEFYTFDLYGLQAKALCEHLAEKGRLTVKGIHKSRAYLGKDGKAYCENKIYQPVVSIIDFKKTNGTSSDSTDDLPQVELDSSDLPY